MPRLASILTLAAAALAGLAAASRRAPTGATAVRRISRVVADLARAEAFYRDGLGFTRTAAGPLDAPERAALGLPPSEQLVMQLGAQEIALVAGPERPPHPADSRSNDLWFQHLAIVVSDMTAAHAILAAQSPAAISTAGPQLLPPSNGGVVAWKFRDPDGHPLELLQFPAGWPSARNAPGPFLGIDHTAIAISAARRSLPFYEALGFRPRARTFNRGPAQSRLDGVDAAALHVTTLRIPNAPTPGLELLRYLSTGRPRPPNTPPSTWTTLEALGPTRLLHDPDGHSFLLKPR